MFKAVVGQAEGVHTDEVIRRVIEQCRIQLDGIQPRGGLLFAARHFEHDILLAEIRAAFPDVRLAGCTSSGEMSSAMGFSQDSVCLMLFASDTISMGTGLSLDLSRNPENAVQGAIKAASAELETPPVACFLFMDPNSRKAEEALKAAHTLLGPKCRIFGGLAGDEDSISGRVGQFCENRSCQDGVAMLLMSGPLEIFSVISNSWSPAGLRATVDAAQGTRVTRIGGQTALEFYRSTFGPHALPLPEMPLAVFVDEDRFYLRSVVKTDEEVGSLEFPSRIPTGSRVQFTEATPGAVLASLSESLTPLKNRVDTDWTPKAGILLSCTARKWIMGLRTGEELDRIREHLPKNMPFAGFYTFGELAAHAPGKSPYLHHCTLVAILLGEKGDTTPNPAPRPLPYTDPVDHSQCPLLLSSKLSRALSGQARLEMQKESITNMLRTMGEDLLSANAKIKEHNQILRDSLTLAQEVQLSLLPSAAPSLPGFDIAGRCLACDETGGDYLDYLPEKNGLSVVVGDVSGHGVAAALLMTTARALLRMRAGMGGSPAELIADLNRFLTADVQGSGRFMTLLYLHLDPTTRFVTWVRAGHEPGLHFLPQYDRFSELKGEGFVLGVLDDVQYQAYARGPLTPGEIILAGTDGITETRGTDGSMFGRDRLMQVVREHAHGSAEDILGACFDAIREFRSPLPPEDDETLVIIKAVEH